MVNLTSVVPNLVVLIDPLDTRAYTDSHQASLKSILRHCSTFRSIVAHSSGSGSFLPVHRAHRILNEHKDNYPFKVEYIPFNKDQAETFLRVTPPKRDVIPIDKLKDLTGFNQSLMVAYVKAKKMSDMNKVIMNKVRICINSTVPTFRDEKIFWVNENLRICQKFFYYATNEFDIPICYLKEYVSSWINIESITYLLEETTEKFKIAVNFPQIIHLLMSFFREFKLMSGFKSSIVDGLFFEDAICKNINTLNIKYSKTDENLKTAIFRIVTYSELMTALEIIHPNIL